MDLTSYIAGSYAVMMLADLGAEVIKVEALAGDAFRELPGFYGWNRGKRSIAVDLKTPEGRTIVEHLAARADDHALAASVAKAYVSDASRKVCGESIQVHGGIGFTWEYDLHLYFKRAKALEAMYGDGEYHRELIVRHVAH